MAQTPYSLIHYDESLLPQTSIGNIHQDRDGYLWMSTQFGIVRFDGEKIRIFNTTNLPELSSNRIRLCAKGPDQAIYFVDENNIILKVISPNHLETVRMADATQEVKAVYTSENNSDFALLQFDKRNGYNQFKNLLQLDSTRELLKTYAITDESGYFFYIDLQQETRLCYYDAENYLSRIMGKSFKPQHTFKINNQIFSQESATKAFLYEQLNIPKPFQVSGLPLLYTPSFKADMHVLFSNETGVFFYSSGKLYEYKLAGNSIVATLVFNDLPCTGVVNIMKEKATGDFLISTKSNGFYRIKKKQFAVVNLNSSNEARSEENAGFNSNIVYALDLWDPKHIFCSGYITPVKVPGVSRNFDPSNNARFNHYFLYSKDEDHVWLNINDGNKSLIQSFNKQTRTYKPLLRIVDPRKVIELSNGTTLVVAPRQIAALHNNQVTVLLESDSLDMSTAEKVTEDCILIGTSTGACYFYPSEKRLEPLRYKAPLKVRYIFKDKAGRLWFTTYGQGLFYLSGKAIIPIPLDNAGYLAIGHHIAEDNSGHFWVPTNHGLFKLGYASLLSIVSGKSNKLSYTYFDKTDGFNTNEFNGGCFPSGVYQKETGLLFFPSMNGIVTFHPDSIHSVNSNNAVFFDEIEVNDTGRIYNVTDNPIFPNHTSNIRIQFSSPYYGHRENIKFSYQVSNAPTQWLELQGNRSIVLSNLPGGTYTLVVKKEDATNPPILASFSFTIQKKFSETLLFKLLLLAGVVALVYLYFRTRLHYLTNERKRLEKEVAARTVDQLNLIDQLQDNIAQMKQLQLEMNQMIEHKENVVAVLIHDVKSPLYFLNSVAAHLNNGIETNPPLKNKKIANEISISLNRLFIFTQDFATWLDASRPGYIQRKEPVDLAKIIEEALMIYQEIIEKKEIVTRKTITARSVFGDESMIKSVIRNLVDNAVKNMVAGTLTITTESVTDEQLCEITIADEGKGMQEANLAALNRYFQFDEDLTVFSTSGFGHKVIKDFLSKLGGKVRYRHNSPSGIIVTLKLPSTYTEKGVNDQKNLQRRNADIER